MSNDPNRRKPKGPQPGNDDENRKARRIVMLIVAALIATLLINSLYTTISNAYLTEITYTEFKELLASDQISEVETTALSFSQRTRQKSRRASSGFTTRA